MTTLVKLPAVRLGMDGGYVNPDKVIWIEESLRASVGARSTPVTVLFLDGNFRLEFDGHIHDQLVSLLSEAKGSHSSEFGPR